MKVFFASLGFVLFSAFSQGKEIEYNIFKDKDDEQKVQYILDQVIKYQNGKPRGYNRIAIIQHIDGKNYLVRRGRLPIEAAIIHDAESILPDGTELSGYLITSDKVFTYTTVLGAKSTVKQSDFYNGNYPFKSKENFIIALKMGGKFMYDGEAMRCDSCNGWRKVKAKTPSGWKECTSCRGKGKIPVTYYVFWKDI